MTADAALTVEVVRVRGWHCVRLAPRQKVPAGRRWDISHDADTVARWFTRGFNVGLVCGKPSGVAVLDPDKPLLWADMIEALGQPSLPWALTGSGRLHYYIAWCDLLPAKLIWNRQIVGEIQRGPGLQQVVLPGSVHPNGSGYRWITDRLGFLCEPIDPVHDPLPDIGGYWGAYLFHDAHMRAYLAEQRARQRRGQEDTGP
jgi:hypothetical protein